MNKSSRVSAAAVYLLPLVGWMYVYVFRREDDLAMHHLRQVVGLCLYLIGTLLGWAAVAWILAWLPYMGVLGIALFTIVIAAYLLGAVAWLLGLLNALGKRAVLLPVFGNWADRLPLR